MARADRLLRLMDALRRLPAPVTAARLAAETEVGARTLYRDIATLRAGGALIDGAPGLGYTLTEDPALPPQMFDRLQIEALVLGLGEVRHAGDPELAQAAERALARIIATLPDRVQRQAINAASMVHRYTPRPAPPPHVPTVRAACWDEAELELAYSDEKGTLTRRRILPLAVVYLDHALVCLAWCGLRQDFRRFYIARMADVSRTGASFRPRRVPLLREFVGRMRSGA